MKHYLSNHKQGLLTLGLFAVLAVNISWQKATHTADYASVADKEEAGLLDPSTGKKYKIKYFGSGSNTLVEMSEEGSTCTDCIVSVLVPKALDTKNATLLAELRQAVIEKRNGATSSTAKKEEPKSEKERMKEKAKSILAQDPIKDNCKGEKGYDFAECAASELADFSEELDESEDVTQAQARKRIEDLFKTHLKSRIARGLVNIDNQEELEDYRRLNEELISTMDFSTGETVHKELLRMGAKSRAAIASLYYNEAQQWKTTDPYRSQSYFNQYEMEKQSLISLENPIARRAMESELFNLYSNQIDEGDLSERGLLNMLNSDYFNPLFRDKNDLITNPAGVYSTYDRGLGLESLSTSGTSRFNRGTLRTGPFVPPSVVRGANGQVISPQGQTYQQPNTIQYPAGQYNPGQPRFNR